jgi:hypothetical protein
MTASMKAVIERTLPIATPTIAEHDGKSYHPLRHNHPELMFVSVAGFPDNWVFNELAAFGKNVFSDRYVGEVYMGAAAATQIPMFKDKTAEIFGAIIQAGRELIISKEISEKTAKIVNQQLGDPEIISSMFNIRNHTCIAEGVTSLEFDKKNMVPDPKSIEDFITLMQFKFDPDGVDKSRTIQFIFSGSMAGACNFKLNGRTIEADMGETDNSEIKIKAPFEVMVDIMRQKTDLRDVLKEGKIHVEGDEHDFINIIENVFIVAKVIKLQQRSANH